MLINHIHHVSTSCQQLIAGFGFRITGCYPAINSSTNSVLVTSSDPNGIQILITTVNNAVKKSDGDENYLHFDACEFDAVLSWTELHITTFTHIFVPGILLIISVVLICLLI